MKIALVSGGIAIVVALITTFGAIWANDAELKKAQLAATDASSEAQKAQSAANSASLEAQKAQERIVATGKEVTQLQEKLKLENSGRKTCSAHYNEYVDTIVVPQSWSATTCESWALGASAGYHLGCIFPDSISINREGKGAPSPNCGW